MPCTFPCNKHATHDILETLLFQGLHGFQGGNTICFSRTFPSCQTSLDMAMEIMPLSCARDITFSLIISSKAIWMSSVQLWTDTGTCTQWFFSLSSSDLLCLLINFCTLMTLTFAALFWYLIKKCYRYLHMTKNQYLS